MCRDVSFNIFIHIKVVQESRITRATIKLVEGFIQEAKQEVSLLLNGIRRWLFHMKHGKQIFQLI